MKLNEKLKKLSVHLESGLIGRRDHARMLLLAAVAGENAKIRYASDYTATYKGVSRLFPLHVTLGAGLNPRTCMSIYFDWDPEALKLILARFGRHGRGL